MSTPPGHPAKKSKPSIDPATNRLLTKLSQTRGALSFKEAYDLLDEIDLALDRMKDHPEFCRDLGEIRSGFLVRLDARAKELGETEKWEVLKKERSKLHAMDKLLGARGGMEFFDTFRELSPKQRDGLEKEVDLQEVKKFEPLAEALRQNSIPQMLLAMLRTSPLQGAKLLVRYFWQPVVSMLIGFAVLFWQGPKWLAGLFIIVGIIQAARIASR